MKTNFNEFQEFGDFMEGLTKIYDKSLPRVTNPRPAPALFHYTDAHGIEGILRTKSLWATHGKFTNDPLEGRFVQECLGKFINEKFPRSARDDGSNLWYVEDAFRFAHLVATLPEVDEEYSYCVSFSEAADDLSQYRAYCGGGVGYCVEIDPIELQGDLYRSTLNTYAPFTLVQVKYGYEEVEHELEWLLSDMLELVDAFAGAIDHRDWLKHLTSNMQSYLSHILSLYAMCYKPDGFRSEREWRIIPIPKINRGPVELPINARCRAGILVPYVELPFPLSCIKSIYGGPKIDAHMAKLGLRTLLAMHGLRGGMMDEECDVVIRVSKTRLQ